MKKNILICTVIILTALTTFSQSVGIGTNTPDSNAVLELKSSTKGLLLPRTSTTTKLLIPNVKGMMVFDTTTNSTWTNDGTQWVEMAGGGGSWSLTGNAGTTPANFIGTTDNTNLNFRRNNTWAGQISILNTFLGFGAGQVTTVGGNAAFGSLSLQFNDAGHDNTAIGFRSLQFNTSGFGNTASGASALESNIDGSLNTGIGASALYGNTSGIRNTATGYGALAVNTTGSDNTATGMYSLYYNNNGFGNSAYGSYALSNNTTGDNNTAVGEESLATSMTDNNTAVGYASLYNNGGIGNTAIGYNSDVVNAFVNNGTAIGNGAIVGLSNRMRMGNVLVTSVESFGTFNSLSDARFKTDIKENVKGLDFILKLRPVTYQIDKEKYVSFETAQMPEKRREALLADYGDALKQKGITRSGFLAQEVVQAMKQSGYDFDGVSIPENEATQNYSLAYGNFTVPLVKAVQEQQAVIETLKKENDEMKKRQQEMEKRLLALEKK